MTREEIKRDLELGNYIKPFKARRYIEFLVIECDNMEAGLKREHGWAKVWAVTAEGLKKELDKIKRRRKK